MNGTTAPAPADRLRAALDVLLDGLPERGTAAAVERLIHHYRGRTPTDAPILRDRADAAAYAAYRMPATFGAVSAALDALAARLPGWEPASHLDVGGGTGAAIWAADAVWPGGGRPVTVLDWAGPALDLGRELARGAGAPSALRASEWRRARLAPGLDLPAAELVTVSYVLGELTGETRDALVDAVARTAGRVAVFVEPGTPEGFARVRRVRERLVGAGMRLLAPCPHDGECPIVPGADWCHFAARIGRSALHRRVKGGELGHEDEKYSWVAVVRPPLPEGASPAAARIVRRPRVRKGLVLLNLCTRDEGLREETVTRRDREAYRAARRATWGDASDPTPTTGDTDPDAGG
ncbi:small ribosomal subunit Rsm22 family protein [Streptomyces sp. ST2-7A]|uniref:small ribosomal subunit Rsm22 family protein n=1 Tax=Streptomyces sp. ST2-7A TaxID=2907214 RepID=UPI001F214353|nr:small ribosomal subunit Rsm22 family protein [Streptomyces sp. ST2-7A]MCE7081317.1 small ribosomal subunit Rsm22 family protein [Streptomyces sp. ST2-7A]